MTTLTRQANRGSILVVNDYLRTNDYLVSPNGQFFVIMQSDGNLCVYHGAGPHDNRGHMWSARSDSAGEGSYLTIMQGDGNLCVYRGTVPSVEGYVWSARSDSAGEGSYFTIMQDDGNLCVYRGTVPSVEGYVWSWMNAYNDRQANRGSVLTVNDYLRTNDYLVSPNGQFFVIMQSDGNLCVYRGSGPNDNRGCMWWARTDPPGEGVYITIMQNDGNLCVYRGTTPSVETYVWSWMDFYSHLFRKSSSFLDTIGKGIDTLKDIGTKIESAGKTAWKATSQTATGLAEGAELAGLKVSDSFIAGAEATRSALETGAEATRQGLVEMGHYATQHACSIAVGSALGGIGGAVAGAAAAASLANAGSDDPVTLRRCSEQLAALIAGPVSSVPGLGLSSDDVRSVLTFIILKALTKPLTQAVQPREPNFIAGAVAFGLTTLICEGKLPGGYGVWKGAQS
jgi:hypothetical protein